jgi:hypothetical protein
MVDFQISADLEALYNYVFDCGALLQRLVDWNAATNEGFFFDIYIEDTQLGIDTLSQEPLEWGRLYYQVNNIPGSVYDADLLRTWFQTKCTDPNSQARIWHIRPVKLQHGDDEMGRVGAQQHRRR